MTATTFLLSLWGSVLSTVLAIQSLRERRRLRERRVDLVVHPVYRPRPDQPPELRLHIEATNLSEHAISIKQWLLARPNGDPLLAGSPYEGRIEGPDMLQPRQLHGWTIEPETLALVSGEPAVIVVVVLTSGERFQSGPVGPLP